METSLKRVGSSKFNAMLVASGSTGNPASPTLLLHFVEENKASTVFVASEAAREQFAQLEIWRIYDMEVNGKCVKRARVPSRLGVRGLYEVVLKFPLKQLTLSKRAWPFDYGYQFIQWGSLNQQEDGSFVDVAGVVVGMPEKDVLVSLPKIRVTMSSESHISRGRARRQACQYSFTCRRSSRAGWIACSGVVWGADASNRILNKLTKYMLRASCVYRSWCNILQTLAYVACIICESGQLCALGIDADDRKDEMRKTFRERDIRIWQG